MIKQILPAQECLLNVLDALFQENKLLTQRVVYKNTAGPDIILTISATTDNTAKPRLVKKAAKKKK